MQGLGAHRQIDVEPFDRRQDSSLRLTRINAEHGKGLFAHLLCEPLDTRHLLETGQTPARPEVDQHHLARELVQTALPAFELRDPNNGHVITPGDLPYTLVNGGKQVIYAPDPNFLGEDSFQFKVNDGGVPPDGGDSNVATVVVIVTVTIITILCFIVDKILDSAVKFIINLG